MVNRQAKDACSALTRPAAFERRCIPPDCVVRRLHMPKYAPSLRLVRRAPRRSRCNAGPVAGGRLGDGRVVRHHPARLPVPGQHHVGRAARIGSGEERAGVSEGLEAGASGILRPRNARRGRGGPGRVRRSGGRQSTSSPRPSAARAAPPAAWPSGSPRPRPPPPSRRRPPGQLGSLGAGGATHTQLASRPLEPAPTSSRTHSRPRGARGASGGRSTSWPTSTARTRSRRRQAARSPVRR